MQAFNAVSECANEDHDHEETIAGKVVPMTCAECGEPCHYDMESRDYHHNIRPGTLVDPSLLFGGKPHTCWLHKVVAWTVCFTYLERQEIIFLIDGLTLMAYGCHAYDLIPEVER